MPMVATTTDDWAEKEHFVIGAFAGGLEDSSSFAIDEMQQVAKKLLAASLPGISPERVQLASPESTAYPHSNGQEVQGSCAATIFEKKPRLEPTPKCRLSPSTNKFSQVVTWFNQVVSILVPVVRSLRLLRKQHTRKDAHAAFALICDEMSDVNNK